MGEIQLTPLSPLGGADIKLGANQIRERTDLALVSIAVPLGGEETLAAALSSGWGLALPSPTVSTINEEICALRLTPDQIMLAFPDPAADADKTVGRVLAGTGYTSLQTDAWVILEISGPDTRGALERLCPIDIHETAFPTNAAARTTMEHMSAILIRLGMDRFMLMSASSSARSFLHAVETSFRFVLP
ncbi:MAG: sarcosine oxidase subunit gamma [Pseudomonadota bacterium]